MIDQNIEKLKEIFKGEVDELIENAEETLVSLEQDVHNTELINEIFRIFHSIKGSAGLVGFDAMARYAHEVESVLDRVRQGELQVSKNLISQILDSIDLIKSFIEFHFGSASLDDARLKKSEASLARFLGAGEMTKLQPPAGAPRRVPSGGWKHFGIHLELSDQAFFRGQDPLLLIQELADLGEMVSVRANTAGIPLIADLDPHVNYLTYDVVLKTLRDRASVEDVFLFVRDEGNITVADISERYEDGIDRELADKKIGEILVDEGLVDEGLVEQIAASHRKIGEEIIDQAEVSEEQVSEVLDRKQKSKKVQIASSLRVRTDKLDKLINLIGEMVISVARISLVATESQNKDVINSLTELDRISRELQEQIMMIRMVPLESTFKRFFRVVRDLATTQHKVVNLHISGEETELDKTMIEQITDPLKHMIRNSIDHGVETPEARIAAGKPEAGSIWLKAFQEEGNVVIVVEDDGHGMDPDKIYKKAVEKGLVNKKRNAITDEEIFTYVFLPGFSTAEKVTEISGRGVGMDVVKKNVEALKGRIEVKSTLGKGSTFKIKIPLTIAIIDGMQIRIGSRTFVIPLDAIIEAFQVSSLDLKSVKGSRDLVNLRGSVYPLIKLHEYFGAGEVKAEQFQNGIVVLVESTFKKFCIYVDEILGIHQAVIKNLQTNYRSIPGIIGASLNGDGTISLIMDIPGIERIMQV